MKKIEKNIRINAPRSQIYEYLTDPSNLPEIWPSMVEVSNVKRLGEGAHSFDFIYKMAGVRFHGHAATTRVTKDKYVEVETKVGLISTFHWNYEARDGFTEVKLQVDYEVPVPLLGKLAENVIVKLNENECETLLATLKDRLEVGGVAIPTQAKTQPEARR